MKPLLLSLFILSATAVFADVSADKSKPIANPDLHGKVVNADGKPLADSTVFIFSGGPRVGASMFCPTCYPDCRKHAQTDANGEFHIESLDSSLLFRLLVVNKDFKPKFVPRTDPFKGPVEIALEPRKTDFPEHQALRGKVIAPDGSPIKRAVVNFGFFGGREANCGGQCDGVDLVAVADEEGRFVIGAEKQFDWMTVSVETPGYARRTFYQLASEKTHDLKMTEGAILSGRVVKDGQAVAGVAVGLVSADRGENFTGNYDTFSDAEGQFHFFNVPPYHIYHVYTLMDRSVGEYVALATKIRVTADGTHKDIGDIPLLKGSRLKGKIQISDGKPLPTGVLMTLGRNGAWDSKTLTVAVDGTFETTGVPFEAYSLSLRVPGYTISPKNKSLDKLNGDTLVGRIDSDTYLQIQMDPGAFARPDFSNGNFGPDAQPYDKPMQGIEIAADAN